MFTRKAYKTMLSRLKAPRKLIQVVTGPRQVGKTTLLEQIRDAIPIKSHYASADDPMLKNRVWIEQQWHIAQLQARAHKTGAILILDEIQKIPDWSSIVKALWDKDSRDKTPLKVVLLGSSPLLIQKGLTESLAGRFETVYMQHWSYSEMKSAFNWTLEQYIYFGGYPGAASLIHDQQRWTQYIVDSLIETTISRDVLLMNIVKKPALLRRLFQLGCQYSGQVLSFQKMMGQLHDAGNTTTLAHYLDLLSDASILTGLQKYANKHVRQRSSSPKFQVFNNAFISAQSGMTFEEAQLDREFWGRLVESAVGAHLINEARGTNMEIFYFRDGNQEVDFILRLGKKIVAIEVKSGRYPTYLPGLESFKNRYQPNRVLLVGGGGVLLSKFLSSPLDDWLD
jgi:predicted AAA+ superfamily ATPase